MAEVAGRKSVHNFPRLPAPAGTVSYFMVDVEADGPCPGRYSMVSFGAIHVTPALDASFFGRLRPASDTFLAEALANSGLSGADISPQLS